MPCIYNIPKNEYRHCELCTALYCDERPSEQNTMSATQYKAHRRIQKGEVATANQMTKGLREATSQLTSSLVPVKFNGRLVKIKAIDIMKDPDYGYCVNIKFKYDNPTITTNELKEMIRNKKEDNGEV